MGFPAAGTFAVGLMCNPQLEGVLRGNTLVGYTSPPANPLGHKSEVATAVGFTQQKRNHCPKNLPDRYPRRVRRGGGRQRDHHAVMVPVLGEPHEQEEMCNPQREGVLFTNTCYMCVVYNAHFTFVGYTCASTHVCNTLMCMLHHQHVRVV